MTTTSVKLLANATARTVRGRSATRAAPCTNAVRRLTLPPPTVRASSMVMEDYHNDHQHHHHPFHGDSSSPFHDYDRVPRSMSPSASVRRYGTAVVEPDAAISTTATYSMPFRHQHVQDPSSSSSSASLFSEDYDEWNLYDAPASVTRSDLGQYGVVDVVNDPYGEDSDMILSPFFTTFEDEDYNGAHGNDHGNSDDHVGSIQG